MPSAVSEAALAPLDEEDIERLIVVGREIWSLHYASLLSRAQIDYMMGMRFTAENLRRYLDADDRWLNVLRLGDEMVGYCSHALTDEPAMLKLEQLYLLPRLHGRGLGGLMMRHIESHALELGCPVVTLQVNKGNAGSIAVYLKSGFAVREELVLDIGRGFVMDDYVMEKTLI